MSLADYVAGYSDGMRAGINIGYRLGYQAGYDDGFNRLPRREEMPLLSPPSLELNSYVLPAPKLQEIRPELSPLPKPPAYLFQDTTPKLRLGPLPIQSKCFSDPLGLPLSAKPRRDGLL